MTITDAQVHVWAANRPSRPWPPPEGRPPPHGAAFLPDDLLQLMDSADIDRAVLVPPSFEGDRNDLCLAAARAHPDRFAVMGRISMTDPASRDLVPDWLEQPGMLGVRLTFGIGASRSWLADGTCDWFWKAAEAAQVPVMAYPPGELRAIATIAARHPGLRLVIDHFGVHPSVRDDDLDPVLDELVTLASLDNVAVKASTLPTMVSESYPFGSLHTRIKRVVDAFGPSRVFWGSDLSRLTCTYAEARDLFLEELDFLDPAELDLVMGSALSTWIRWPSGPDTRLETTTSGPLAEGVHVTVPPSTSESIDETELLSITAVRFVRVQGKVLSDLDEPLTYAQFITLARIGEGHRSIVALAGLGRLTLPTVSQSVDGLVKRGLVSRSQDENDRRLTVLSLTPAGISAVQAAKDGLGALVGGLMDRFDEDGRRALTTALTALHDWTDEEFERQYAADD